MFRMATGISLQHLVTCCRIGSENLISVHETSLRNYLIAIYVNNISLLGRSASLKSEIGDKDRAWYVSRVSSVTDREGASIPNGVHA